MTNPGYDWSQPSPVSDVDLAFPARALEIMPTKDECEAALSCMDPDVRQKWFTFANDMFMGRIPYDTFQFARKPDVDAETAWRHLRVVCGSYSPRHEHKIAALTYLASLWYEDFSYEGYTEFCRKCGEAIGQDDNGTWVDATEGDGCSGDPEKVDDDQGVHEPRVNA